MGTGARFLCDAHQSVVRPARAVKGGEVARHDVENVPPWQPACGFMEDFRRQLFHFERKKGVGCSLVSGETRRDGGGGVTAGGARGGEGVFVFRKVRTPLS